jgi:ribonuclease P/MRP protein subunit RPP40
MLSLSPSPGSSATSPRVRTPGEHYRSCLTPGVAPNPDPLSRHFPANYTCNPGISQGIDVTIPKLTPDASFLTSGGREDFDDFATGLYEWLALVRLQSPRVQVGDQIDPYLSRYQVPEGGEAGRICKISWQGFLAPSWSRQALIDIITALPSKTWFSLSTTTFSKGLAGDNSECTILRPPNSSGEYLMWEVKSHE